MIVTTSSSARGAASFSAMARNGRIPPVGPNNILAARYQVGGGTAGNIPPGKISQLLGSAAIVQSVTNPRGGDGGAAGETIEGVKRRGPQRLRHLGRALSAADYEALAREASPGVAMARALPATAPNGRPAPGSVTLIIVPHSLDPRPQPSFELRRQVYEYIGARVPASLSAGQNRGDRGRSTFRSVRPLQPSRAICRKQLASRLASGKRSSDFSIR